jgi:hypothetical protein
MRNRNVVRLELLPVVGPAAALLATKADDATEEG